MFCKILAKIFDSLFELKLFAVNSLNLWFFVDFNIVN